MPKASRDKGIRGELEVVYHAVDAGLTARRTASLQCARGHNAADVQIVEFPELHIEVKRNEKMSVDAMVRQAEADAPDGSTPIVAYRRNRGSWRAVVPLSWLLKLLVSRGVVLEGELLP